MPGDLQDPTQLFPFHIEKVYEPGTNPFEAGSPLQGLVQLIQNLAGQTIGRRLTRDEVKLVNERLEMNGFLLRNWGDEGFKAQVEQAIRSVSKAKKVVEAWLKAR
jgi:hypothetical protein